MAASLAPEKTKPCTNAPESSRCFDESGKQCHFQSANRLAVTKALSLVNYTTFKQHYPDCKKEDHQYLRACHKQYTAILENKIMNELGMMYTNENILNLLDDLDGLIRNFKADKHKTAWRPIGNPEKDSAAHRVAVKLEAKERLTSLLNELKLEEGVLLDKLEHAETALSNLENLVDVKAAKVEKAAIASQRFQPTVLPS